MAKLTVPATPRYKPSTKFVHQMVPLSELHVDREHYQRDINETFVQLIVDTFDEAVLGELLVSKRKDGTLWVIDGQTRLAALRRLGWTHAPSTVVEGLTIQQEAKMFYTLDTQRRKLNAMDLFRARVVAEEESALHLLKIIDQAGFKVDLNSATWWSAKPGYIRAVDAAELALRRYGEHSLLVTLSTLRQAWPEDEKAGTRPMILGLARLHFMFNDVMKMEALTDKLSLTKPATIIADARAFRDVTQARMDEAVAQAMWERYRKNRTRAPKWGSRVVVFSATGNRVAEYDEVPVKRRRSTKQEPKAEATAEPTQEPTPEPVSTEPTLDISDDELKKLIDSATEPYTGKAKKKK